MANVDNMQDTLDSREVIERRDELKEEREALTPECIASMGCLCAHHARGATLADECGTSEYFIPDITSESAVGSLAEWDAENAGELAALEAFIAEGSDEWADGVQLVRETAFEDHARELADDIGIDPPSREVRWPYTCIDWERAARELQYDYTGADFDGVTYWFRS